jgi:hypothetical protein
MFGLCMPMRPLAAAAFYSIAALSCQAQIVGHSSTGATQTLTLTGTAQSLTVPMGTVWATICIEVANARWRDDGVAPTAAVGQPLVAGQCMQYAGPFNALQLIAQTGSPIATVSYYR